MKKPFRKYFLVSIIFTTQLYSCCDGGWNNEFVIQNDLGDTLKIIRKMDHDKDTITDTMFPGTSKTIGIDYGGRRKCKSKEVYDIYKDSIMNIIVLNVYRNDTVLSTKNLKHRNEWEFSNNNGTGLYKLRIDISDF